MPRKNVTDEVISYLTACKDQCEEETRSIRAIWAECLSNYMCEADFSKKKDWQFKVVVPISKPKIKKATRLIKRIMVSTGQYFDFDTVLTKDDDDKIKQCNLTKRILHLYLRSAKFVDTFAEALESGFTMAMMIMKFWVGEKEDHFSIGERETIDYIKSNTLKCKAINPLNFWFSKDKTIQIEDEWITLPDLVEIQGTAKKDKDTIYDVKEIEKAVKGDYSAKIKDVDKERLKKLGIEDAQNKYRKDVKLTHFWGPLITKDNKIEKKNCHFCVVNEIYLIVPPRDNPFWHKKSPYVFDSPLNVIFRHVGKALMEDVRGIENAIGKFIGLQLDNLLWQMLGVREVDEMAFDEAGRTDTKELFPGKTVRRRPGYSGKAFQFHELGVAPETAMPMLQELKMVHEEEHGVSQYVQAQVDTKRETATAYSGKKQDVMGDFHSIALDIERGFLVDCIDRSRDLVIQYLIDDTSDSGIKAIFKDESEDFDALTVRERRLMIMTDLDIVGRGISIFFEREEKLNKLGSYVKFLNAMPEEAQMYPKWPNILRRINDCFAFDAVDELINTDDEIGQIQAKRQKAQMQQIQMAMQKIQQEQQFEMAKIDKQNQVKMLEIIAKTEAGERDRTLKLAEHLLKPGKES